MKDKKHSVLYVITQSEWGGAQRYVFDLATSIANDWDVSVAFGEQGTEGAFAKKLREEDVSCYSIPSLVRKLSFINDVSACYELMRLIMRIKPDVVHLNSSKVSIVGSAATFFASVSLWKRIRVVYTAHGWVFNEPLSIVKRYLYIFLEWKTAFFKDAIICVSDHDRAIALQKHIASRRKLVTIWNGIDLVSFKESEDVRRMFKKEYGIPEKGILIGSVGNLYRTKGFEYAIEAMRSLRTIRGEKAYLCIIGEGEKRPELEDRIREGDLEGVVFLAGSIPNASELLKGFDVYVSSSVKEGLSYTLIEALQAGLPIVATRVGGSAEVLGEGEAGVLIEPAKSDAIMTSVLRVFEEDGLRDTLGKNARKRAIYFIKERMVKETVSLYNSLF
jgi:glycosyltransferase involved in cell wall biosynthesis